MKEIDELRDAISRLHVSKNWDSPSYRDESVTEIEEKLRTYMINGTTSDEILSQVAELDRAYFERRRATEITYRNGAWVDASGNIVDSPEIAKKVDFKEGGVYNRYYKYLERGDGSGTVWS